MKPCFRLFWVVAFLLSMFCPSWASRAEAQTAPVITEAPVDITRSWQNPGVFSVVATGAEPLSYQWYRGASGDITTPMSGATGALLVTPPLTATTSFWVRVSNAEGSVDSSVAIASLTGAPSQPLTLVGMGANHAGQLGDGSTTSSPSPVQIVSYVISSSAGYYHSLFVKSDGSL